ncbi:hypothetical protein Goshw_015006, partial [Gossypium schwendimanii]|nr:hypothetical protein [Gossypium schwendimanii]
MEVSEREACLIVEAEERFMKLTEIREAKFMDMMDAREKKHRALFNECMAKGMSNKYKAFHSKHSKLNFRVADLMIKPSVRMMKNE